MLYNEEFKKEAVAYSIKNRGKISQRKISGKFGIHLTTLIKWVKMYGHELSKKPEGIKIAKKPIILKDFVILTSDRNKGGKPTFKIYRYANKKLLLEGYESLSGKYEEVSAYSRIPTTDVVKTQLDF